jgi:hypothetical protein
MFRSQGNVIIFNLLFRRIVKIWIEHLEEIKTKFAAHNNLLVSDFDFATYMNEWMGGNMRTDDRAKDADARGKAISIETANLILKETLERLQPESDARDKFIRRAIVNREDEFGNSMLHLVALNGQTDMFDQLIRMGADLNAINKDGLTPFTLSARFGLWEMFRHIWTRHFTNNLWRFGNVVANDVDYLQYDSTINGLTSFVSVREIDLCVDALVQYYILSNLEKRNSVQYPNSKIAQKVACWCEERLSEFLPHTFNEKPQSTQQIQQASPKPDFRSEKYDSKQEQQVKSALRLITLFRPNGWYEQTKDKMEEIVGSKWSQGYYLIHIGDSLTPYCVLILLFGLMWERRRIHILEHHFWWSQDPVRAPSPNDGIESSCGWASIRDSYSGRLQATLIMYGVPSLLRLAIVQCRLRPSDLDENVDWQISSEEVVNFMYLNLESLLHIVTAGLFIVIGAARVSAGNECDIWYLRMEKNATSIAALGIFFNLFILCKPYRGFGLLVLTWYRFLLADVFNFLVMYGMIFVAFLMALQTLHNANISYLMWMDQTDTILPQVQAAIGTLFPNEAATDLTYLANSNAPSSSKLLSTETVLDGCLGKKQGILDTAFALLEISFGDGLADALEEARTKPYNCAGFKSDYLTGYLLVFWVFLTNTLIMNMLIAMMNHSFDAQIGNLHSVWLLDISKRIMRYESAFPELTPQMTRPVHLHSIYSLKYWLSRLDDLYTILFCVPEVHFVVMTIQLIRVLSTKYAQNDFLSKAVEDETGINTDLSWKGVKDIIDQFQIRHIPKSTGCCQPSSTARPTFWDLFWHPHATFLRCLHGASRKAVAFGYRAEREAKRVKEARTQMRKKMHGTLDIPQEPESAGRLVTLILRLERLKDSLQNHKLKIEVGEDGRSGRPVGAGGGWGSLPQAGSGDSLRCNAAADFLVGLECGIQYFGS